MSNTDKLNNSKSNGDDKMGKNEVINMQVLRQLREQNGAIMKQAEISNVSLVEIENMYYEIMNVRDEMGNMRMEMTDIRDEVVKLNSEIDNKVFISEGMVENLTELIKNKSTFVAKEVYEYDLTWNELSRAIGKVRPKFWSLLKNHCSNARKITTIKYKDYEKAVLFADSLTVYDFESYCGRNRIPSLYN